MAARSEVASHRKGHDCARSGRVQVHHPSQIMGYLVPNFFVILV